MINFILFYKENLPNLFLKKALTLSLVTAPFGLEKSKSFNKSSSELDSSVLVLFTVLPGSLIFLILPSFSKIKFFFRRKIY